MKLTRCLSTPVNFCRLYILFLHTLALTLLLKTPTFQAPKKAFGAIYVHESLPVMTSSHNGTIVNGWVSEPSNTRGTFSILSSCILTLTLCVYTAIHLNIPSPTDSELHKSLRTMKWVFLGIFAPELVVFVAWRQYISVTALETTIKRLQSSGNSLEDAIGQGRLTVCASPCELPQDAHPLINRNRPMFFLRA